MEKRVFQDPASGRSTQMLTQTTKPTAPQEAAELSTHDDSVRTLASLFRAKNPARPILLLGAGASFSSAIPLAEECVKRIAKRHYADKVRGGSVLPEQLKPTEWQDWLQGQPWFIAGEDRLAENFPLVVEHLLWPREYRRRVLLELMRPAAPIGQGYQDLAQLMLRGLVETVLTTNFDTCLPDALTALRPHLSYFAEVHRRPDDFEEFSIYSRAQIVWLHGRTEQYSDCNLVNETQHLNQALVTRLVPMVAASPLVVIGYRGAEPSITDDLLLANIPQANSYRNGIFWCVRSSDTLHPRVQLLRERLGRNFKLLAISQFDELMADLNRELRDEDCYPYARALATGARDLAFDDRPVADSSQSELDWDLMLAVMRQYCEKLNRPPVTHETLPALLREQGLLVAVNGSEVPTVGCILLFGVNSQHRFPHSTVAATICGKKRMVFEGNLIQQGLQIREWLGSDDVNPVIRVKRRATHADRPAYAERALTELLVNLLVHRDYEDEDCSRIDVEPGVGITFENPGNLPEAVARRVTVDKAGRFQPVPHLTSLRNRALCDVFFGMREMERAGTGLTDVRDLAQEFGGSTEFIDDTVGKRFTARILQPTSSGGSTRVARHSQPTGLYIINALPFSSLPDHVSVVRLRRPFRDRPSVLDLSGIGTFVTKAQDLWSFVPLGNLSSSLGDLVDVDQSKAAPRAELEADELGRDVLAWLLRKHFERYLGGFALRGLRLEGDRRKRRAYFEGKDGGPLTITYDSPRRRAISRQVVKQRREGADAWFENEGFGYAVVQLDGDWAIRIKPFYMFTGKDAKTPLPPFARASRATRRMKFDRNKNVEDDLTFWARFLSSNSSAINIGQEHVDDLLLGGSFMTFEVPEAEPGALV